MERNGMKKVMLSLMLLMIVVVAQGQAPPSPSEDCGKKCALGCASQIIPIRVALCYGICKLKCKLFPPQAVHNCTGACAKSIVDYNPQSGI